MREIIKLGLVLLLITSIAAVVLGFSNSITKDKIKEAEALVSEEARKSVLSQASKFQKADSDEIETLVQENPNLLEIYKGLSDSGDVVGYAIKTATSGYGGNVEVITGISSDGKITGMNVVSHQETPGLGANATTKEFQNRFKEKSASKELVVVKASPQNDNEIQALTGATITSDAVVDGVNVARQVFNNNLK